MTMNLEEQTKRCEEWTNGRYIISCNQYEEKNCPMTCVYALKIKNPRMVNYYENIKRKER
jgi:hypothetical protein